MTNAITNTSNYFETCIIAFSSMITKREFATVIKNLARCCTELFNYFPRAAVICFHRWITYALVNYFTWQEDYWFFYSIKNESINRGREGSGSSDEADDRERAKYENVNNENAIQIYVRARGAISVIRYAPSLKTGKLSTPTRRVNCCAINPGVERN